MEDEKFLLGIRNRMPILLENRLFHIKLSIRLADIYAKVNKAYHAEDILLETKMIWLSTLPLPDKGCKGNGKGDTNEDIKKIDEKLKELDKKFVIFSREKSHILLPKCIYNHLDKSLFLVRCMMNFNEDIYIEIDPWKNVSSNVDEAKVGDVNVMIWWKDKESVKNVVLYRRKSTGEISPMWEIVHSIRDYKKIDVEFI